MKEITKKTTPKNTFNPQDFESKWAESWETEGVYRADDNSSLPKSYVLIEFPYPSGARLHVGHARSYSCMDAVARLRRMKGMNVLYPFGWDAFGLPAENFAIKTGVHPTVTTKQNISNAKKQAISWGLSFDWSREVNTTDPSYYKWTQWIFVQLFKKGLAYKEEVAVNWCPSCKINLADEEVINAACERCGTKVERRLQSQWMLRITEYADRLLEDLSTVDYREDIRLQQENWIGRKEGAKVAFRVQGSGFSVDTDAFTTRIDTLYGVTFLVVAPEVASEWMGQGWKPSKEVMLYVNRAVNTSEEERKKNEGEKTGVDTGLVAVHPATGEEIPVYVAEYVLRGVGTGVVMGVPAHDERDFAFAKKHDLPIKQVVEPLFVEETSGTNKLSTNEREAVIVIVKHWEKDQYICLKWMNDEWVSFVSGGIEKGEKAIEAAAREVTEETGYTNFRKTQYLGKIHSIFHHVDKKENVKAHFHCYLLELESGDRQKMSSTELSKHTVQWVEKEEVENVLNLEDMKQVWKTSLEKEGSVWTEEGILTESGKYDGMKSDEGRAKMIDDGLGEKMVHYHLRDWVFSRQHYWGEPIPILYCDSCWEKSNFTHSMSSGQEDQKSNLIEGIDYIYIEGKEHVIHPVEEEDLPVTLPEVEKYEPTDTGESPLATIEEWVNTICPKCGGAAKRETDTMPNWAGSSWYFLAYVIRENLKSQDPISKQIARPHFQEKVSYWMPVDWYNGGMEHTTLHLLYSRFWYKFLYDIGVVPGPEPYGRRTSHGVILGPDGRKMSKSRGNVINPDDVVQKYGADTLRMYEMFVGPFSQTVAWSWESVEGVHRFIRRVWNLYERDLPQASSREAQREIVQLVKKVEEDIEDMKYNTAVAACMEFVNFWSAHKKDVGKDVARDFLKVIAPMAPFVAEELWNRMKNKELRVENVRGEATNERTDIHPRKYTSIHREAWPEVDESMLHASEALVIVQVNGKKRGEISVSSDKINEKKYVRELAVIEVERYILDSDILKEIYVPGKILNFVIKDAKS